MAGSVGGRIDAVGDFVQFTSGSTRSPQGILLDLVAVESNVLAILEALDPVAGDRVCSWLPLSHDMGLIGLCLAPWVGASPSMAGQGTLSLIRPEAFLRSPSVWLKTCSQLAATITAAPSFAFGLAARAIARSGPQLDLSPLRVCITGADTVRAQDLREFTAAATPLGFKDKSFCPAYGLAEATLAVTMVRPDTHWSSYTVDPVALAAGRWVEQAQGRELVSTGAPLKDMRVRIGANGVGPIEVAGPSLLSGYVGADSAVPHGAWLATQDLGFLVDGELIVTGRQNALLVVAGRNLYAGDIEDIVNAQRDIRGMNSVALADDDRYFVVAEAYPKAHLANTAHEVRAALARRLGAGPSSITFLAPGALPKTPSGKLARARVRKMQSTGELTTTAHFDFRPNDQP
jgi:acyl-CoA synthetase (AMP-forming)/AMP-acid ligase II